MHISLYSEWLKTKRTSYRNWVFLLPAGFNLLLLAYILLSNETDNFYKVMENIFSLLVSAYPFAFLMSGTLLYQIDKEAGCYKNIIHSKKSFYTLMHSKFLFYYFQLVFLYIVTILFAFILLFYTTSFINRSTLLELSIMFFKVWILSHTMIVLSNFISSTFSFINTMIICMILTLLTIIIGMTGLGEGIWLFFPFTWAFKFLFIDINVWLMILISFGIPFFLYFIILKIIDIPK